MSFDPQLPEEQPAPPSLPLPEISYALELDERRAADLGQRVLREVAAYELAVAARRENARTWRDDFEVVQADIEGPWANSADLRAPFTNVACSNHATRLNGQFLGVNPYFGAKIHDPKWSAWGPAVEEVLTCYLTEGEWPQAARDTHGDMTVVPDPLIRTMWATEKRRMPRHVIDFDEERFEAAAEATGDGVAAFQYALDADRQGQPKYRLEFEEVTVRDGLEFRVIPWEETVVLPPTAKRDQDLWGIGEYLYVRGLDLERGAEKGLYRKEAVEKLLKHGAGQRSEDEQRKDLHAGLELDAYEPEQARYRDYRAVMLDWWDDLNDDGECEWYWLLVDVEHGLLLQCMFSPYEHGESRYTRMPYISRTAQLFSASIAERLAALQDAGTCALNDLLNLCDLFLGLAGMFWYDARSQLRPDKITFAPGRPQYVPGSVEGIKGMEQLAGSIPPGLQSVLLVLEKLKEYADLVSATSNPALGRETSGDKTLGEVRLVLGNAQQIFSDLAQGVALRWARVCDQARWLIAQYGTDEYGRVRYRKTAAPGSVVQAADELGQPQEVPGVEVFQQDPMTGQPVQVPVPGQVAEGFIPAEVLRSKVDLEPLGLSGLPDAGSRLQRDLLVLQAAQANPVVAGMPDVLADMFKEVLQDSQFPNHDALKAKIDAGVQALQMAQQLQQALALQSGLTEGTAAAQEGERAKNEERRQEESHQDNLRSSQQARDKTDLELLGAVPNPNTKNGKGAKK